MAEAHFIEAEAVHYGLVSREGVHRTCDEAVVLTWGQLYASPRPEGITLNLDEATCPRCLRETVRRSRGDVEALRRKRALLEGDLDDACEDAGEDE